MTDNKPHELSDLDLEMLAAGKAPAPAPAPIINRTVINRNRFVRVQQNNLRINRVNSVRIR